MSSSDSTTLTPVRPQVTPQVTPLIRTEWIDACHFHELTEKEVLMEVAERVARVKAAATGHRHTHPLVLLDLDSTLYEVGPRTYQIVREWVDSEESQAFPYARGVLTGLKEAHLYYSIRDIFNNIGLSWDHAETDGAFESIKNFWQDRFFTSAYLPFDRPYPGAAEFAQELHRLGAELVYLTGRDEPGMGDGTRANLIRDGFPWNTERTHLLMKAAFHLPDLDHKLSAAEYIRTHGTLIASFENEPPNVIGLYEIFPDAMHVFVDTVCSDHPALPREGLYRIKGFVD